jgi:hypothetical protein
MAEGYCFDTGEKEVDFFMLVGSCPLLVASSQ